MEEVEQRTQSNFGTGRRCLSREHPLPAGSLSASQYHHRPSSLQPHQLLLVDRSSVYYRIIYFYIMLLQSLHFYRKESHRALKWGLSRVPSAANQGWALADPVPLQLLTCPQWMQKWCPGHGSQQLPHSQSIPAAGAILCYPGICPSAFAKFFAGVCSKSSADEWLLHRKCVHHCNALPCCDMQPQRRFTLGLFLALLTDLQQLKNILLSELIHQLVVYESPYSGPSENVATTMCKLFQYSSGWGFFSPLML